MAKNCGQHLAHNFHIIYLISCMSNLKSKARLWQLIIVLKLSKLSDAEVTGESLSAWFQHNFELP